MRADPDVIRTRSLLIWSQTRYRCATESILQGTNTDKGDVMPSSCNMRSLSQRGRWCNATAGGDIGQRQNEVSRG